MIFLVKNLKENYNPLYFLAALGPGGMAVSFFMYFMFMVPHPGLPMPTADQIFPIIGGIATGENTLAAILAIFVYIAIVYFVVMHIRLLIWNIREYNLYKQTSAYQKLLSSNAEVTLMAIPLTVAMTVNSLFIVGAIFVPGLFGVIEYLLPGALVAFLVIGIYALRIFAKYFSRFITNGDFDFGKNNNLSQMIAIFSFSMIAVGLASPAAMSHNIATSTIGLYLSLFFATIAVSLIIIKLTFGVQAMFNQGINKAGSASLWIMIPILTVLGITFVRLFAGVNHNFFETQPSPYIIFVVLTTFQALQIIFGIVGYVVMKRLGYFEDYVFGNSKDAGSYALICPYVAFSVLGNFVIGWGLLKTGIVPKFSIMHFILLAPFVAIQFRGVQLILTLNKKHFSAKAAENKVKAA